MLLTQTETSAARGLTDLFCNPRYVAHEAVHGPLEAPVSYIEGPCSQLVPEDHPARRIYCGMVRAADESLRNISDTYKGLSIWDETLVILSAGELPATLSSVGKAPLSPLC